ncbi:MAG: CehA/McbA family metallohydrolase [Alphaproteobacteria bacterium]|nr:CehA/McbA family metallohydrolase [Alphaproteobacteria bacterium]MCB9791851.1 CehA/McbA family metallohydrolase [Alphaproteobacteria bacterium]
MNPVLLTLLLSCTTEWEPAPFARAKTIESLSEGIGGPKAIAQPGDYLLENDKVRVAIVSGRYSMGPGLFGGGLVDADLQRYGGEWTQGEGNDRLAEMFTTVNMNVIKAEEPEQVFVLNDGQDGEAAVVRVIAREEPFISLLGGLWALIGAPRFNIATDYILEPGARYVRIRTTVWGISTGAPSSAADAPPEQSLLLTEADELPVLELALETGIAFGDFYLQGGAVDVFAPGLGFDEDGAVYEAVEQGQNTFEDPFVLDYVAGTADGVSYALASLHGPLYVPLFTSSQTAGFGAGIAGDTEGSQLFDPLDAFTYERIFAIGDGDVGSVYDTILLARQEALGAENLPIGRVEGHVLELGSMQPVSGAHVFAYLPGEAKPFSEWQTDVSLEDTLPDGSFGGYLPVGDYELLVHERGRPVSERIPVTVTEAEPVQVTLGLGYAGEANFVIVDEAGLAVPSKVTVMPYNGDAVRDPVLGDGYIAGDPEAVLFCPYGHCGGELPPGRYTAYATRGMEYELGVGEFEVLPNSETRVELQVRRSVDTSGWISADFHVHSMPSHDSGVTATDRVITMASEHVEYFISSDHDYVTDFRPVVEELGLEPWIRTDVGVEVTPVELGHYIAFPVEHDYLEEAGGAFDWTGMEPEEMVEGLIEMGRGPDAPVTMVAHPRDGILGYFDQYGFTPYVGTPGEGGEAGEVIADAGFITITNPLLAANNFTVDYDALELLNGKRYDFLRTPTLDESDRYAAGEDVTGYDVMTRTLAEQQDLMDGVYPLVHGRLGQIDDWFTLLNLGFRYTALGNSDTHGKTSVEAGCPRNYVASLTDDPAFIRTEDVAAAVKAGEVFTTYGPFLRFTANDEVTMGGELVGDGPIDLYIEVQSPTWFDVDRVELYRNGTLIYEQSIETPNSDVLNLAVNFTDEPEQDSWYVLLAAGDSDLYPLFTPTEYAPVQLQDIITDALSSVPAVSGLLTPLPAHPRDYPTYPFALTNPIWVDIDGDGFDAPGIPEWFAAAEGSAPEE